jgi:hypothetical protein
MTSSFLSCLKNAVRAVLEAGMLLAMGFVIALPCVASPATQAPPMGWNSFNAYAGPGGAIRLLNTADFFADPANRLTHFKYLVIDDGWEHARVSRTRYVRGQPMAVEDLDPYIPWIRGDAFFGSDNDEAIHKLQAAGLLPWAFDVNGAEDRSTFMRAVGDYIHSKGMKFGLYGSETRSTCFRYPGSLDHELEDASLLASWGVDFVKLDDCTYDNYDTANWKKIIDLLREFNPAIVVSLSNQGLEKIALASPPITECVTGAPISTGTLVPPKDWSRQVGADMWRMYADVRPIWTKIVRSIMKQAVFKTRCSNIRDGWSDGDFLVAANVDRWHTEGFLTPAENRTQLSVWAMFNSPLMASFAIEDGKSADPHKRHVYFDGVSLLANQGVAAINQTSIAGTWAHDVVVPGFGQSCDVASEPNYPNRLPCVMALARLLVRPDCQAGRLGEYALSITNPTDSPVTFTLPLRDAEAAMGEAVACSNGRILFDAWGNAERPSYESADASSVVKATLRPHDSILLEVRVGLGTGETRPASSTFQNRATRLCMEELPWQRALVQSVCTGEASQQFQFDSGNSTRIYGVVWDSRGRLAKIRPLDAADASGATGTPLVLADENDFPLEWWSFGGNYDGLIRASLAAKCIGPQALPGGGINYNVGALLVLQDCAWGNAALRWDH